MAVGALLERGIACPDAVLLPDDPLVPPPTLLHTGLQLALGPPRRLRTRACSAPACVRVNNSFVEARSKRFVWCSAATTHTDVTGGSQGGHKG
eukprot:8684932-Pyramimonas_sp.AAC.1